MKLLSLTTELELGFKIKERSKSNLLSNLMMMTKHRNTTHERKEEKAVSCTHRKNQPYKNMFLHNPFLLLRVLSSNRPAAAQSIATTAKQHFEEKELQ